MFMYEKSQFSLRSIPYTAYIQNFTLLYLKIVFVDFH
jgi:hypothetical protein